MEIVQIIQLMRAKKNKQQPATKVEKKVTTKKEPKAKQLKPTKK
jgi:hypothetical protein